LSDFTEGFIGKMKVRRSGKVEFELGSVTFDGSPIPSTFLQVFSFLFPLFILIFIKSGCVSD